MTELKVKLISENAKNPERASDGAAGYDLRACLDAPYTLRPGEIFAVPTGVCIELPDKLHVAMLCARSGLAIRHGITLANSVGIIDSDYRGEIKVGLVNLGGEDFEIVPGERICQMLILPVALPEIVTAEELSETVRGAGGFGSTGRG
ncbi:MAG: dUTP diphosphatase [Oscillospiraceae bacterium]|nr:dUTP diphosphatase [Oscillospiraceae bacterium]